MKAIKKKILFFSRESGSANCVIPIYRKIKQQGQYRADLFGKDYALDIYRREKLNYFAIGNDSYEINLDFAAQFLAGKEYGLVVTGAAGTDLTERILWQAAKKIGIKTIAVLDHWLNYRMRFEGAKSTLIFPDAICVMDKRARHEMIRAGFPAKRIEVTGQPYLETVLAQDKKNAAISRAKALKKFNANKKSRVVTFVSQPIREDKLDTGYTQFTILDEVTRAFLEVASKYSSKIFCFLIKIHPRDDASIFSQIVSAIHVPSNMQVVLVRDAPPEWVIAASDLVIGMSSMLLLEAALVKKPYLSVQIGLKDEDPFVLSRMNISKTILFSRELIAALEGFANGKKMHYKEFVVARGSIDKIVKIIDKCLSK